MSLVSAEPGRRHGYTAVRQSILETARDMMRAEGAAALSLNEIARRLGMKTPSLYTYFASKHDLYDALFLKGIGMFRERLAGIFATHHMEGDLIESAIADYMNFADENPDLFSLVFERPVPGFIPSEASMQEAAGLLADGERQFRLAIDAGFIESGLNAVATRDLFIAVTHGLTSLKRANEPTAPLDSGRFGPLIPSAAALLTSAWRPRRPDAEAPGSLA